MEKDLLKKNVEEEDNDEKKKRRFLFFMLPTISIVFLAIVLTLVFGLKNNNKVMVNVNFDANAGTVEGIGKYKNGDSVTLIASPKNGYTFVGWTTPEGVLLSTSNPWTFILEEDAGVKEIRAMFFLQTQYSIILDYGNGVSIVWGATTGQDFHEFQLGSPNRTGYTFDKWYSNQARTEEIDWETLDLDEIDVAGVVTLYAKFTPITYTIVFNVTDPYEEDDTNILPPAKPANMTVTYDVSTALTHYAGDHSDWYFKGWSLTQGGNVVYLDGASILNLRSTTGEFNLYAVFSQQASAIFSVAEWGGTSNGTVLITTFNGATLNETTVDLGLGGNVEVSAVANEGYKFDKWYTTTDGSNEVVFLGDGSLNVAATSTIYAKFIELALTTVNLRYNGIIIQPFVIMEGHTELLPSIVIAGSTSTTTWYVDANANGIKDIEETTVVTSVTAGSSTTTLNYVAVVVEQAEFIFNLNEVPFAIDFGVEVDKGISVHYYDGTTDKYIKLTEIGSTHLYHAYIPDADVAGFEGFEVRLWQDSNSNGNVDGGELKLSNWIAGGISLGEDIEVHFVNTWINGKWQATRNLDLVKTLSFDAGQIASWGAYYLRVVINFTSGAESFTYNWQGTAIDSENNGVLNQVYTLQLVSELGVSNVEIWFTQYADGGHQHKGSMPISWAKIGTVTMDFTYNGDDYVNGWLTNKWAVYEQVH
ncbi:MAG: InlB B-repeat-containing protein [Acholeplasmatales bacterium]|nr:InlB B-repeat-containing protein [Acholeplasmatales bacterium]